MESVPFTLVSSEDHSKVFAYGLEIRTGTKVDEAVTYRRDPQSGHTMFGVHTSAEAARGRFSMITPLDLVRPAQPDGVAEPRACGRPWR